VDSREYTLLITRVADSDSKSIRAFTVAGVTATTADGGIDEDTGTIGVTVPYGTDLTNLTPTLAHTGASYTPMGAQDFTYPVVYTVMATNTTTKPYTVTVQAAPSSARAITSFTVAGVTVTTTNVPNKGFINEETGTIDITVPYGTVLASLSPEIKHTGASYVPTEAQNFVDPVEYTVKAADGSEKTYTVTVTIAALSSIEIITPPTKTAYVVGEIPSLEGAALRGTDSAGNIINVTGDCVIDRAGYDFSAPGTKTVTVTHTPSGKTAAFQATVVNNAKSITSFTVAGVTVTTTNDSNKGVIDEGAGTISVTVPYGTNLASLSPTMVISANATANPASGTALNFSAPQTYTVTAEDGTSRTYAVTVSWGPGITVSIANGIPALV
jgi:hypothetical protein